MPARMGSLWAIISKHFDDGSLNGYEVLTRIDIRVIIEQWTGLKRKEAAVYSVARNTKPRRLICKWTSVQALESIDDVGINKEDGDEVTAKGEVNFSCVR